MPVAATLGELENAYKFGTGVNIDLFTIRKTRISTSMPRNVYVTAWVVL
jgi:hypothetical protein